MFGCFHLSIFTFMVRIVHLFRGVDTLGRMMTFIRSVRMGAALKQQHAAYDEPGDNEWPAGKDEQQATPKERSAVWVFTGLSHHAVVHAGGCSTQGKRITYLANVHNAEYYCQ